MLRERKRISSEEILVWAIMVIGYHWRRRVKILEGQTQILGGAECGKK